ncbi:MAG: low specificity L-threonine aldolase [Candidatus Cloacimonetes bacterium]|nr:low specificity L-threonine aldolase [Candidatus Cloacimonadota bacterium]
MNKSFASDNNSGVHPNILNAIVTANNNHYVSYGDDPITQKAIQLFKQNFGDEIEVFFVLTGTGANVTALQSYTDRFNAVICVDTAHINVDECGAPEHALSAKLINIKTDDGKLRPEHIKPYLHFLGDQHHIQPKVISITQPTELGTLYSIDELKSLIDFAHQQGLKVHLDGARLANAVVALNSSFKQLCSDLKIDVLSFGGTKNGMLAGEAVIFFNKEDAKYYPFIRKQNMQLISKMRYISAQFIPYFENNIWYTNAKQANEMALYLYQKLNDFMPKSIIFKPKANALFVKLNKDIIPKMQAERFFYTWDEDEGVVRFMTSFDMTKEDIDDFVLFIKKYID